MSGDELRERGIAAAKAGRKDEARKLLAQAAQANPRDTQAWLFLASVTDDKKARLLALRNVLEIDSGNALAIAAVKALGIDPEKLLATSAEAAPKPADDPPVRPIAPPDPPAGGIRPLSGTPPLRSTTGSLPPIDDDLDALFGPGDDLAAAAPPKIGAPTQADLDALFGDEAPAPAEPTSGPKRLASLAERMRQTGTLPPAESRSRGIDINEPGVPLPDPAFVEKAVRDVEFLAQQLTGQPAPLNADWTRKSSGRAGEADIWRLRAQVWGMVGAFILTIGIIGIAVLSTPEAQRVVFGRRTIVPSRTPTNTATFTPGFTPTPTATLDSTRFPTYTPSATIPLTLSPAGRPNMTPRPTDRYLPRPLDGGLPGAVSLLDRGLIDEALPTLDAERVLVSSGNYNPNPYYFDAIALARVGKFSEALNVLTEGEERIEGETTASDRPRYQALIDLGFAEYELLRGIDFRDRGEFGSAAGAFAAARARAQAALEFDPRYAQGHLIIARSYRAERQPEEALEALDQPLMMLDRIPEFGSNVDFVIERGEIHQLRAAMRQTAGDAAGARADREAALYQGYYAVYLNPYDRRGHEMLIDTALALGRPGDAVLANDTYRLYYPEDPRALRMLGDARIEEGNPELALGAYAAALDADLRDDGAPGPESADILAERAQVFYGDGEFAAALADLNAAVDILPARLDLQAQRMDAAFAAGEYETALADAQALFGSGARTNDEIRLMEARALLGLTATADQEERRAALRQADDALDFVGANLPAELRTVAGETRATVLLELGFAQRAVDVATDVLSAADWPPLRLIRGRAYEALFRLDLAARDYQRVLDQTIDLDEDLAFDAREGLERVGVASTATSTAVTATAIAGKTATREAQQTATQVRRETATQQAFQTATAEAEQSPTPSPSPTRTPSATPDDEDATGQPTATRTPSPTGPTPTRTPTRARTPLPTVAPDDDEPLPLPLP